MTSIPWLLPGIVAAVAVAMLVSIRVAAALRTDRRAATFLVTAVGLVAAATLTPTRLLLDYGYRGSGVCDLTRFDLPRLDEWLSLGDPALNVLLFVPLGAALGCLPRTGRTAAAIAAAALFPFVIELVQLLVKPLGRGCQSGDVVANLLGLLVGFASARVIIVGARRRSRAGSAGQSAPSDPGSGAPS